MKRFESIGLTAVLAISATVLAGCDRKSNDWQASSTTTNQPTRVCVDKDGKRVPDQQCPPQGQVVHNGGGGIGTAFLWYYMGSQMGRSYAVPPIGRPVTGGGFVPTGGVSYGHAPAGAVSRGGFGGIGARMGFAGGSGGAGE